MPGLSLPPAGLWDAIRRVVYARGYVTDLADRLTVDKRDLYRWSTDPDNANGEHRAMPAAMIVPLTRATDDLTILEHLADECGCILTRRPAPASSSGQLAARLAVITMEFADVQRTGADLLGDGVITPEEARGITHQIDELEAAAEALRLAVAHLVTAPRRPSTKVTAR